jgi:hypothetical protein
LSRLGHPFRIHFKILCFLIKGNQMNDLKPLPAGPDRTNKICPVCGKRSYSQAGIHPQCSMDQADAPRKNRLAAERKATQAAKMLPLDEEPTGDISKETA